MEMKLVHNTVFKKKKKTVFIFELSICRYRSLIDPLVIDSALRLTGRKFESNIQPLSFKVGSIFWWHIATICLNTYDI